MDIPAKLSHFLCIGPQCWGRGATRDEALRKCAEAGHVRRVHQYLLYRSHPESFVDSAGYMVSPDMDAQPVLIERKRKGKPAEEVRP